MKLGTYTALDQERLRQTFLDYVEMLDIPLIDYVAIGLQNTIDRTSSSMMSRLDWQQIFKNMNLAEHDPIRKASFYTRAKIFSFDDIDYLDNQGKEVMRQRRRYDINSGFVVLDRHLGHNFMLTLATGYKNFSAHRFYLDHMEAVNRIFVDLKNLITPSIKLSKV